MSKRQRRRESRNPPKQSRSRATVATILEAAVRVLDREGSLALTTTRIAEVAGISVGTLYQYFSHRDAILDALQDREFERAVALLERVLTGDQAGETTSRERAQAVIEGLLALYAAAPGLHRVLVVEGLRVTPTDRVQAFDLRVVTLIRHFLSVSTLTIRRPNPDAAAFVIYQAVRAAMLARLFEAPPGLTDPVLVEELTDLVLRYLVDEKPPQLLAP